MNNYKNYNEYISATNSIERINFLRQKNEKGFWFARIAVELESLEKKFKREGKSAEWILMNNEIGRKISDILSRTGIRGNELLEYCKFNKIRLNYN